MGSLAQQAAVVSGKGAQKQPRYPALVRDDDAVGIGTPSTGVRRRNGRGA